MAESVIFVGWDRAFVGREKQTMQLFQKVMEYNSKLQAAGKIESFEAVMLSAHGGDMNGFVLSKVMQESSQRSYKRTLGFNSPSRVIIA